MLTSKEIMMNILLKVFTLTADVEHVDNISLAMDQDYREQMYCLSLNSYFETRGGSFNDKVSVAQAVMMRVEDDGEFRRYSSPCEIVTKSNIDSNGNPKKHQCWYSWYCDGKDDTPEIYFKNGSMNVLEYNAWKESVLAAFYAYENIYPDLIGGATHYYNASIASPHWSDSYETVAQVGEHVFSK